MERVGHKSWAYTALAVPHYERQARVAHERGDAAKRSAKGHSEDVADMRDVAANAAVDLETRKKYRRKRSASARNSKRK